jgi:regulatory protein
MLVQKQQKKPDKTAYSVAVKLLAMREHSEQQLRQKLSQRGYDIDDISDAIQTLYEHNFLSDWRFAESYLGQRKRKGYGPVRIQMELRDKGVSENIIHEVLQEDDTDWYDMMKQAYVGKYGEHDKPEEYAEKAKRCRFLQNRGFPVSSISKLIDLS